MPDIRPPLAFAAAAAPQAPSGAEGLPCLVRPVVRPDRRQLAGCAGHNPEPEFATTARDAGRRRRECGRGRPGLYTPEGIPAADTR